MTIKIIVNPRAGSKHSSESAFMELQNFLSENNLTFNAEETICPGNATELAKIACEKGFKMILVVGGDGTLNEVLNGIYDKNIILGVIPAGSGNDFARSVGIFNLKQAFKAIINNNVKLIDIGLVNNRYFINAIGFGFDAEANKLSSKIPYQKKNKNQYLYNIIKTIFKYKPKYVKIKSQNEVIETKFLSLTVGNGACVGGGFHLTPNALLDDGSLDVCLIKPMNKLSMFYSLPKASDGSHIHLKQTKIMRVKEIEISSTQALPLHIDGEPWENAPYNIKVVPHQLKVLSNI